MMEVLVECMPAKGWAWYVIRLNAREQPAKTVPTCTEHLVLIVYDLGEVNETYSFLV